MKNVIGVFNPFGLVQKAGRKRTSRKMTSKMRKQKNKTKRSFYKKK